MRDCRNCGAGACRVALAALAWASVAVVMAALAVVWLDLLWELSAEARSLSLVVAILAGAVVMAAGCGWATRRGEFSKLARRLDQVGGTGGQIVSGYDLSHALARFGIESDLSRGLAAVAVDRASELAAGVSIEQAAPWQPAARRPWAWASSCWRRSPWRYWRRRLPKRSGYGSSTPLVITPLTRESRSRSSLAIAACSTARDSIST